MRRKITLLMIIALSAMSAIAHSGRGASKLNLQLFDDGNFTVILDGIRYPNVQADFRVPNLYAGTHRIKIVEVFYGRRGQRTGREVLYAGPINIPYNSRVTVRLTQNNRLRTVRVDRLAHRHNHRNDFRRRGNSNRNYNRRGFNHQQSMFFEAKQSIRREHFEKDKLFLARETARTQNLNAHQVAEIMNLLAFESSRLQFAKYAYRFSGGNPNYLHIVSRQLDFASSRRELARFMRQR